MKKYFVVFLVSIFSFSFYGFGEAKAESNSSEHKSCCRQNNISQNNHQGCSGNCSTPKVLTFVENFQETFAFPYCGEHSFIKYSRISHYSDGSTDSNYRYTILGKGGVAIADNLNYAKHFINTKGKHYFIIKSPDYVNGNFVITDDKGNVSNINSYSKYRILSSDNLIVKQNKKYGMVDFDNNILLDIKYNSIEEFDDVLMTKYIDDLKKDLNS